MRQVILDRLSKGADSFPDWYQNRMMRLVRTKRLFAQMLEAGEIRIVRTEQLFKGGAWHPVYGRGLGVALAHANTNRPFGWPSTTRPAFVKMPAETILKDLSVKRDPLQAAFFGEYKK